MNSFQKDLGNTFEDIIMSSRRIACIDIGGTKIKGCLFLGGRPQQVLEYDTFAHDGGAPAVLKRAEQLLRTFSPFEAIGISTAGQVDPNTGIIRYANDNIPGYTNMDVAGYFQYRFHCPVAVLNDVCAAALGEGAFGGAQGESDYICLTYGTGIGGGVVINHRLYYGPGPSAGGMLGGLILYPELIDPDDPFAATYERHASVTALCKQAATIDPLLTNGRAIFHRIREPHVQQLVDAWLDKVSAGLISLIHIFNPSVVVLGGGIMEQPYAVEGVTKRVHKRLIPSFSGVRIIQAKLGNMAGLYGALYEISHKL